MDWRKSAGERSWNYILAGDGFASRDFSQKYIYENQFVWKTEHKKTHEITKGYRDRKSVV